MTDQKHLSLRAWLELLLLSAVWSAVFLAVTIALREVSFLWATAHRLFWGALTLWLVVVILRIPIPRDWRVWGFLLGMGVFNNAVPFSLQAWAQLEIETGLTAILNATTAIFGVLLPAAFFGDEKLTRAKLLGVGLGFFGVVVTIGPGNLTHLDPGTLAQWAVLGSTLSYAVAGVWARSFLSGLHPLMAACGMVSCSAIVLLGAATLWEGPPKFNLQPITWAAISYYAVFCTALAYLLYYRVLGMAGAANLMLVTLIMVPLSVVLGGLVLGEALGARQLAGFGLIALGLVAIDGRIHRRLRNRAT